MNGFKIVEQKDVVSELVKYRKNYNERGKYLGFNKLDEHYTMMLGSVTDWTGFPMSGKTQILMECLLNTSEFYGWKHLVYFPDVGNSVEIISDLLHKKTGKTFNPKYSNHITEEEIYKEMNWILHHFKILTKSDVKAKMTPFDFWDYAVNLKKEEGLHTACIDSWKDMNHPYDKMGQYATYLEEVLPYRNQIAEDNDLHLHTVIHPKLPQRENGKIQAPSPYDLKGGSEWFNSGKCMITAHRASKDDNEVQLIFGKIKPRSVGTIGECSLYFDMKLFRYYELTDDNMKRYAQEKGKEDKVTSIENVNLKPNFEFDLDQGFPLSEDEAPF